MLRRVGLHIPRQPGHVVHGVALAGEAEVHGGDGLGLEVDPLLCSVGHTECMDSDSDSNSDQDWDVGGRGRVLS